MYTKFSKPFNDILKIKSDFFQIMIYCLKIMTNY